MNQSSTVTSVKSNYLDLHHRKELFTHRGLDPRWCEVNCRSVTSQQASELLGYKSQSDGLWLESANFQGQFKPNKPWKSEEDKKAPKYRSGLGEYDVMLPHNPDDLRYWDDLEALKSKCYVIDGNPCLLITEGFFKAIALCSNGIPTVALLGVEMGLTPSKDDPQGKRYVVPGLERLASSKFGFIYALDADSASNPQVNWAQLKLAHQLKKFNVPQYSVTGLWSVDQGKGADDYIQKNGADKFKREVLASAVSIEQWEKQFNQQQSGKPSKIPAADVLGAQIAEQYRDRLLWVDEFKSWIEYSLDTKGVWSAVSDTYVESAVYNIICGKGISGFNSVKYVSNVMGIMRFELYTRHWKENPDLLPFNDGVLNLKSGEFSNHSPNNRLTWCLPRPYNEAIVCQKWDKIDNWFDEFTQGNQRDKEVLIHFAAAILRGRADLHKFLHLMGPGGNGKSVYTNLLISLIGEQNCWIGSLESLEDKHEVIRLLGKRLALFPDQDKASGKMGNFKRLTGQDPLTGRKLHKDGVHFRFPGMAVVTSNSPIFQGMPNWLKRRILALRATHKPKICRDLTAEFEPELSAFTRYLLTISNSEITRVLRFKGENMGSTLWESAIRQDSIAAWINEWVIFDDAAITQIGCDRTEWENRNYNPYESTLFGSYSLYCRQTGLQAKGKNNFSSDLIDLCQQVLTRDSIAYERCRATGKRCIWGLRLRTPSDSNILTLEESLTTNRQPTDGQGEKPESLPTKHPDNPDNLLPQNSLINSTPPTNETSQLTDLEENIPREVVKVVETTQHQDIQDLNQPSSKSSERSSASSPLPQQIINVWDNQMALGKLVLSLEEKDLTHAVSNCTPQQIAHIKVAANSVWQPGVNRDADYMGDRCEIWEAGHGREISVKSRKGGGVFKVKRGNLRPWLGNLFI